MWCDHLRCLHSFLKIEVDLCFKFDLREAFDIRDFLKETTTSVLKLRFDCIYMAWELVHPSVAELAG
jgi:hypothetical protein